MEHGTDCGGQAAAPAPILDAFILPLPTEDSAIRCEQLDMLQDWLAEFRKSTSSSSTANPEELVAFDVICGDLNFDNCSSGEVPPCSGGLLGEGCWASEAA